MRYTLCQCIHAFEQCLLADLLLSTQLKQLNTKRLPLCRRLTTCSRAGLSPLRRFEQLISLLLRRGAGIAGIKSSTLRIVAA